VKINNEIEKEYVLEKTREYARHDFKKELEEKEKAKKAKNLFYKELIIAAAILATLYFFYKYMVSYL
jgi:hypothetical protein